MAKHLEPEPEQRRTRPLARAARIVAIVLIGIAAIFAGYAVAVKKNPIQLALGTFVQTPQQVFGKSHLLVLVIGLDYDYTNQDEEYSSNSRSDVIKALNLDFANKQVYVLDVPRDMVATLPGGEQAKINQAQAEGGIRESSKVIASFLGIPGFDRYVILRPDSMKELIDAIGGVDVNVKDSDCIWNHECKDQSDLDYVDTWGHLYIHLKPGTQHLNGTNAVGYSRFRHDWCSDPCRIMRQDQVIAAMIKKIKGDKLNTLFHAGQLIATIRRNVTTNLTTNQMLVLANYFMDFSTADLHTAQVSPVGYETLADGGDATIPDEADLRNKVQSMLISPPVPLPSPNAITLAAIPAGTIRIDVENGSGVPNAAHDVAAALRKDGFVIGTIGDAPSSDVAVTQVHEHSTIDYAGAKVREALPVVSSTATLVSDDTESPKPSSDVTVIVGRDLANDVAALKP